MDPSVSIVIPTFGDLDVWGHLADKAVESARNQTVKPAQIIRAHEDTLAAARNVGARKATSEWLIFLDADDELDRHYVAHMLAARDGLDVIQPSTLGVYPDGTVDDRPVLIPKRDLAQANYLVIGSMVRWRFFHTVGGFQEFAAAEDWAFFLACYCAGARIGAAPKAIYRVHVRPQSRNTMSSGHGKAIQEIRNRYAAGARSRQERERTPRLRPSRLV